MGSLIKNIRDAAHYRTTYRVGLLQARAYRILKQETAKVLKPMDISVIEWAFLGLLYDAESLNPTVAATLLGVETPFITATVRRLRAKDLVRETKDVQDSRKKNLSLTEKGNGFVEQTENYVREEMRRLIAGVSKLELANYLHVLKKINENAEKE